MSMKRISHQRVKDEPDARFVHEERAQKLPLSFEHVTKCFFLAARTKTGHATRSLKDELVMIERLISVCYHKQYEEDSYRQI